MLAASRAAHKENMGIYMQAVPSAASLPRIEGKRMVSPKSPEDGLLQRSEEWFRDIVPDKVTRNLSRCACTSAPASLKCLMLEAGGSAGGCRCRVGARSSSSALLWSWRLHLDQQRPAPWLATLPARCRYTSQMEDVVRSLMQRLETATDDTRTALATHGLPDVLDAMHPGYRPELPEVAKVALAEEFVRRGVAGQLPSMVDTLQALRDQARARTSPAPAPTALTCTRSAARRS